MERDGRSAVRALRVALCCALCTGLVLGSGERLRAQQPSAAATGTILQLDGADVLLDLGSTVLSRAQKLTVYRGIEVRHPLSGKRLRDRFVIGQLSVTQTGQTLSLARAVEQPEHPFAVGDQVEPEAQEPAADGGETVPVDRSDREPAPREIAKPRAARPSPATEAPIANDQAALGSAWFETLGKLPAARAQIYAAFLKRYPSTAYREALEREIAILRGLESDEREARQVRQARARVPALPTLELMPVSGARAGEAIELAGLLHSRVPLRSLVLHARPLSSPDYQRFPVQFDAGNHVRLQLPAALAETPGFGYFVEGVDALGRVVALSGTAEAPRLVPVAAPDAPPGTELRTRVRFSSELVSFQGTTGRDYFLVSEGDFLYRLELGPLLGLRVGYGNYTGRGGTVEQLDVRGLPPVAAGFTYGFVESELGLHRLLGVATRVTVGLGRPDGGEQTRSELTGGVQLRTRLGAADGTHLVLAGELMPEIGQRGYLGLHFEAIRSLPMAAEVVVTDQPVHSKELAVRLVYELGYRVSQRVALALRASYQLRTIAHAGPGLGLATSFDF